MIELNTGAEQLRATAAELRDTDIISARQVLQNAADDHKALREYAERLERQIEIASQDVRRLQDAAKNPVALLTRFIQIAVTEQIEEQTEHLSDRYGNLVAEVEDLQSTVEDLRGEVQNALGEDDIDDHIRDYLRHEATFEVSISVE